MNCTTEPGEINGEVNAPPSKSMMQRAVAAALLAEGSSEILNPSFCNDAMAAIGIAEALGAIVRKDEGKVVITGGLKPKKNTLNCGESGLCMRMFSPIAALSDQEITITGNGSLLSRPAGMIEKPLKKLGAECKTANGKIPIRITGPIKGGNITIDGSTTSQFLSGLLMVLPLCKEDSEVKVANLKSRDYVTLTQDVLGKFGITVNSDKDIFHIQGNQKYTAATIQIEGDWSGAAFILVAGAIAGEVTVKRIEARSKQPDKRIIDALKLAGAHVTADSKSVTVRKAELYGFEFDATDCPDLFPPLVALACNCNGTSRISGVARLRNKESDRAAALIEEFAKTGARIKISGNDMEVTGTKLKGGEINSHNDHRIAMACAVAGLTSEKGVRITNAECVSKSYPEFFNDLKKITVRR